MYQLRILRQETINISPFEEHFGRKASKPKIIISTDPDPSTLTYEPFLNKDLDMEIVRWDELISEEQWDNEARTDIDLKKVEINSVGTQ